MTTQLKILLTGLLGSVCLSLLTGHKATATETKVAQVTETQYLTFQLMTGLHGYAGPQPAPGHFALSKTQLEAFVQDVVKAIGTTGTTRHKLGFTVGPLCFDMSDEETRQFIRDAFAVARENDVAVAFHIDDSMSWSQRKDLLSNPDNLETADWKQIPNTGRRADWGRTPTRFPPQLCFNSPAVVAAVQDRAGLIGTAIKHELATLQSQGKEHLFAGVIAGWETQLGRDLDTDRQLGYRALSHRGFSASNPPKDADLERVHIVKEFMERWAHALHAAGTPHEKIFCHIAFTSQGLRAADAKETYAQKVHFALPEVAFSPAYRPGFSTYPEGAAIKEIHAVLAAHGSPGWISAEGVNVSPTGMPGEPTMETYLARMYNHGAVLVNIFSWGMGGAAMRSNFFRRATENPEALAAYARFLHGAALVPTAPTGFSSEAFQAKMRRIQAELPGWVQKTGQPAQAMTLIEKIKAFLKDKQWQDADKVADKLLSLMKGDAPIEAQAEPSTLVERLPPKIHKIEKELPAWLQQTGNQEALALMKKMQGQLQAKNFAEAEKAADAILRLMGEGAPAAAIPGNTSTEAPADPAEAAHQRVAAKIGRVKAGVREWAASGHDPSAILKTMQEKVGPLLEAGKFSEAEPELDRVLAQLQQDGESTAAPKAPPPAAQDITEELRSKLTHNIGSTFLVFRAKVQGELKVTTEQKIKLDQHLQELLPDAMQALQKSKGARDKYNQQTHEEIAAVLKKTLTESQRTRLHQLELQRDGLFGAEWNLKDMQITNGQRQQFMAPIQETQKKTRTLMGEIQKGANPAAIRPKILQLRLDLEVRLETLLTDAQQKKWKEMLGKPVELGVLFDGV